MNLILVRPAAKYLPAYVAALKRGYSPSTSRPEKRLQELEAIAADPDAFLGSCENFEGRGTPIKLRDGSHVAPLPGLVRWMWDGDFAGVIALRWQNGTPELPEWCQGHVGYSVAPWKRRRGYATAALRFILLEARQVGLPYVEVTTDPDNTASQRVIAANGGVLLGRKAAAYGSSETLRYRIPL
ncbi:MAG: GNAT family N-acetyltransferase [Candidatus Eremiobacteraeota bacterium]|nr:GNAT family N-acetyltransferase [Candidatus Eremiobacteraeota bacterium]MBV8499351.1 GNAT family N-acetyltransferase [Candidatus Eremiobacteraeota bacterium]